MAAVRPGDVDPDLLGRRLGAAALRLKAQSPPARPAAAADAGALLLDALDRLDEGAEEIRAARLRLAALEARLSARPGAD